MPSRRTRKKIDEMLEQQKKAMNRGSLFELMEESPAPQQLRSQPPAATAQQLQPAPHCPPQSQASGPAGGQIPDGQQQTMWPPQQPAQRPAPHQAPPQPQYAGQRPMSRQLPPQPVYAEQQISYRAGTGAKSRRPLSVLSEGTGSPYLPPGRL